MSALNAFKEMMIKSQHYVEKKKMKGKEEQFRKSLDLNHCAIEVEDFVMLPVVFGMMMFEDVGPPVTPEDWDNYLKTMAHTGLITSAAVTEVTAGREVLGTALMAKTVAVMFLGEEYWGCPPMIMGSTIPGGVDGILERFMLVLRRRSIERVAEAEEKRASK